MKNKNKGDKDNINLSNESIGNPTTDLGDYLEEYYEKENAEISQEYEYNLDNLKKIIDKCNDAKTIIHFADLLTDYEQKIKYYTKALLHASEDVLASEVLYKRGTTKLEHATTFAEFESAMQDLLAGGGSPEYGKIDNTIFRKVGVLVQGAVGSLDIYGSQANNCTKWYQLGIDHGDVESYYYLGFYHYDKYEGDKAKGVALFKEGIKKGDKTGKCLLKLGEAYELGLGVSKNLTEAENLYNQALSEGHARAYYYLGLMAARANNNQHAHNLYQEGANCGDGMCMVALAEELFHTNLEEAHKLYIKAGETGQEDCLVFAAMTYYDIGNLEMCKKYYLDCYRHGQTTFMVVDQDRELVFPGVKFNI